MDTSSSSHPNHQTNNKHNNTPDLTSLFLWSGSMQNQSTGTNAGRGCGNFFLPLSPSWAFYLPVFLLAHGAALGGMLSLHIYSQLKVNLTHTLNDNYTYTDTLMDNFFTYTILYPFLTYNCHQQCYPLSGYSKFFLFFSMFFFIILILFRTLRLGAG